MTDLAPALTRIMTSINEPHHSKCACSGIVAILARLQQTAEPMDYMTGLDQDEDGLASLLAWIGAATVTNSHTLETQQSALVAFEK